MPLAPASEGLQCIEGRTDVPERVAEVMPEAVERLPRLYCDSSRQEAVAESNGKHVQTHHEEGMVIDDAGASSRVWMTLRQRIRTLPDCSASSAERSYWRDVS